MQRQEYLPDGKTMAPITAMLSTALNAIYSPQHRFDWIGGQGKEP
jgi:hypothetical protein